MEYHAAKPQSLKMPNSALPAKLQALVATMRKLLHAIYGMFKHNQLFDGQKVYAGPNASAPVPEPKPKEVLCT